MTKILNGSTILVADDEVQICELLRELLIEEGAEVRLANNGSDALAIMKDDAIDAAIVDVLMPGMDGLTLLQHVRQIGNDTPIIIVTAQNSSSTTIEAMQHGAYDYLSKPFDLNEVLQVLERAVEHYRLTRRVHILEQQVTRDPRDIMIGHSTSMQQVYKMIGRVAQSDSTILITGESGTGKELVAQVLHRTSERTNAPFIAVNCAALPESLLESELFGHEKGAFTGAVAQRKGLFEQANKGTLFLDEIGEISHSTQKKLLRVLQERMLVRVGGNAPIKVDVRVITATNRDLLQEVQAARFREDLYYRLNVINIHMPPLRDRRDDIGILINHFLNKHRPKAKGIQQLSEEAMQLLNAYDWPGNVRQLENTIERAIVLAQGSLIGPEHLLIGDIVPASLDSSLNDILNRFLDQGESMTAILKSLRDRLIVLALERHNGDRSETARRLKVREEDLERGAV